MKLCGAGGGGWGVWGRFVYLLLTSSRGLLLSPPPAPPSPSYSSRMEILEASLFPLFYPLISILSTHLSPFFEIYPSPFLSLSHCHHLSLSHHYPGFLRSSPTGLPAFVLPPFHAFRNRAARVLSPKATPLLGKPNGFLMVSSSPFSPVCFQSLPRLLHLL